MDTKLRFQLARNYCLYYGRKAEKEIANFDVAILEPSGQTEATLAYLKTQDTLVLAYLSVLEITPQADYWHIMNPRDLLMEQGKNVINAEYGNNLMDLTSTNWLNYTINQAGRLVIAQGYDGLFLDTLGNLEWEMLSSDTRNMQMLAAVHLLSQLRRLLPQTIIVQNNGINQLLHYTIKYIDGVCYENPLLTKVNQEWSLREASRLKALQDKADIKVLILDEGKKGFPSERLVNFAAAYEFLYYKAPGSYVAGLNLDNINR